MTLFGIATRRPSFGQFTAASVMALGLWLAAVGLQMRTGEPPDTFDAGALLLIVEWACVGTVMGIRPDRGTRHWVANIVGSALLLGGYAWIWRLAH